MDRKFVMETTNYDIDKLDSNANKLSKMVDPNLNWKDCLLSLTDVQTIIQRFYERLIRSVKESLSAVVIKGHSQESFRTLLAEIQGVINDRPLFRSSDGTFVTPYHLIFGNERSTLFSSVNIVNFEHDKLTLLYEKLVGNIKKFWEIWSSSYLTELKNFRSEKGITPRVGDLAFFKAEQRRQDWPVVEILELNETGRVAKILDISNEKTYHRSIRCLVPLEGENVVN
ncbi:hypothetical protein DERF_003115 [Dermatophagoides farinae]|uniref:DUF5641 domain-containing protein n=1 Tax=Dermatophagoides farinae TaxID=6954 RepID=A0A922IEZ2_DERFA|nr:hypothetical protein DERF_003115 [Dermatophagoides farinae]